MSISKELQQGKAAEHLACADLILKGHSAFLADQGLNFDVIADISGKLFRVQVKSTTALQSFRNTKSVYRFSLRKGRGGLRALHPLTCSIDIFAFVIIPTRQIAYFSAKQMTARTGGIKQTVELRTKTIQYPGRVYSNGRQRAGAWGMFVEDFSSFPI